MPLPNSRRPSRSTITIILVPGVEEMLLQNLGEVALYFWFSVNLQSTLGSWEYFKPQTSQYTIYGVPIFQTLSIIFIQWNHNFIFPILRLPSFCVKFLQSQHNFLSVTFPPFKILLSLMFKHIVPRENRNIKWGFTTCLHTRAHTHTLDTMANVPQEVNFGLHKTITCCLKTTDLLLPVKYWARWPVMVPYVPSSSPAILNPSLV
jgi:hypothetical protein